MKRLNLILLLSIAAGLFLLPGICLAVDGPVTSLETPTSNSEHFRLNWEVLSSSGVKGSSENMNSEFTAGQITVGLGSSSHFKVSPGIWQEFALPYVCGDANGDGTVNIADASFIINAIFFGGAQPDPIEAADPNEDGGMNIADASYLINWIFFGGNGPCEND